MTLREIKRTGELAQPSFAFVPRVRWIFFMWLVTTAAIFAMALGAFAKASAKIRVSSRPFGTMSVLKISARREKQSGKEKEKCTKRGTILRSETVHEANDAK